MTTTTITDRTEAVASGTAPIPFSFQAISSDEVAVLRNGVPQVGDFTVQLNGDSTGTVTPLSDWGADAVTVYSDPSYTQPFAFARFGPFFPDQIVPPFDRLSRYVISLKNRMDRTASDATLRTDLAASSGSGLVKYNNGNTVQGELDKLNTKDVGALPAGSTSLVEVNKIASAHSGGTTDLRAWVNKLTLTGAFGGAQLNGRNEQLEIRHTSGTLTQAIGIQGYVRLGLGGSSVGSVTSVRGIEYHIAHEGVGGTIGDAFVFTAGEVDLGDGTGTIGNVAGFLIQNQGNATRITGTAIGVRIANFTGGAPITAGLYSEMSYAAGKWHEYYSGGASSWRAGRLRIGGAVPATDLSGQPTDFLEVVGGIMAHSYLGTIAKLGFGTSAGGSVTQATSKSTGVTLDKPCGKIIMHNASLAANTIIGFNFTNSQIDATDVIQLTIGSGVAAGGSYLAWVDAVSAGSCRIILWNRSGGALAEAVAINFAVIKAKIT